MTIDAFLSFAITSLYKDIVGSLSINKRPLHTPFIRHSEVGDCVTITISVISTEGRNLSV
jgi:hypothetical protein